MAFDCTWLPKHSLVNIEEGYCVRDALQEGIDSMKKEALMNMYTTVPILVERLKKAGSFQGPLKTKQGMSVWSDFTPQSFKD